jgi:hypothetical protein
MHPQDILPVMKTYAENKGGNDPQKLIVDRKDDVE